MKYNYNSINNSEIQVEEGPTLTRPWHFLFSEVESDLYDYVGLDFAEVDCFFIIKDNAFV